MLNHSCPSGFVFEETGGMLYMVNTAFYPLRDDKTCFELSCLLHKIENKKLDKDFELMRADVEYIGEDWKTSIDFNENGRDEFRVYKVLEAD
jgi:hypothetical protein